VYRLPEVPLCIPNALNSTEANQSGTGKQTSEQSGENQQPPACPQTIRSDKN
jgi:hypothetical protein